jgi:hypothetical protein
MAPTMKDGCRIGGVEGAKRAIDDGGRGVGSEGKRIGGWLQEFNYYLDLVTLCSAAFLFKFKWFAYRSVRLVESRLRL